MKYYYLNYKHKTTKNNETILFLHGWGGSKDSFFYLEKSLQNKFNIISIDFYGFGKSKLFKNQLSIYDYVNELYLFLKRKGINELEIICHSFGFRVAIILSSLYDIKINKILVFSGAGLKPKFNFITYLKIKLYKIRKKIFNTNYKIEDIGDKSYLYPTFVKVVNEHLDYLIKDIKSNVFLVWGKYDNVVKLHMYKKLLKQVNNCSGVILSGDHFAYLKNRNKCNSIANNFLNKNY